MKPIRNAEPHQLRLGTAKSARPHPICFLSALADTLPVLIEVIPHLSPLAEDLAVEASLDVCKVEDTRRHAFVKKPEIYRKRRKELCARAA